MLYNTHQPSRRSSYLAYFQWLAVMAIPRSAQRRTGKPLIAGPTVDKGRPIAETPRPTQKGRSPTTARARAIGHGRCPATKGQAVNVHRKPHWQRAPDRDAPSPPAAATLAAPAKYAKHASEARSHLARIGRST